MKYLWKISLVLMTALITILPCMAQQKLPFVSPMFTSGMVLQRNIPIPFWGWSTPGDKVTVTLGKKHSSATADASGKWSTTIPSMKEGGPFTVTVHGAQTAEFTDVLIGDVWICSGQSNMEMGIGNVKDAEKEIASANYPNIRLFTVQKTISDAPQLTVPVNAGQLFGSWNACTANTIRTGGWNGFTAVGYFFGRHLYENLHVPIGLIHTSWGGTPAEAWTSVEALRGMEDYKNYVIPVNHNQNSGATLFNGMVNPVIPYGITGAIWYQGESNAGRAYQYRTLLPTMITDWRTRWNQGDFPFFIVQLANWQKVNANPVEDSWAELREAQSMTADKLPKTGIAVTVDIGEADDIHPKNKQDVGKRLALSALAIKYGKKLEYSGPKLVSYKFKGATATLTFSHSQGMKTSDGAAVKGFAVAGSDHKFHWAQATINGSTVTVVCPDVATIESVRYGWSINPVVNLVNGSDLPASPFRTDNWPGITAPKVTK